MRIEIWLKLTSVPIKRENVLSTYEKGSFYCILLVDKDTGVRTVEKYPLENIWKVVEPY